MKKILFASTALVAAGVLSTGSASASDAISLSLGGYSKWWVVGAWNSNTYEQANLASTNNNRYGNALNSNAAASYNNVDVKGDNMIFIGGKTTLNNGMKVGVDVHVAAGGNTLPSTDTIDKSYVWLEGGFGKFLVGSQKNGTYLLGNTAPDAAGNWNDGGIMTDNWALAKPVGVNAMAGGNTTLINTTDNAAGITYVAPTFYGLTVGGSYIPNGQQNVFGNVTNLNTFHLNGQGPSSAVTTDIQSPVKEVYGVGALYATTLGPIGVKVDAGWVTAQLSQLGSGVASNGWQEQRYGANLSYAGFTLGGSYRHQMSNNSAAIAGGLGEQTTWGDGSYGNGRAYDLGLQYATGPYAVSFAYYNSAVQHGNATTPAALGINTSDGLTNNGADRIDMYQLSGKYNLGPGVDILASGGYAVYNGANSIAYDHNSGWTAMSGLSLTF
ncbi:MAG: porin [Magnetospirillum sp.]|nr:porin [Magnetospirillum sp.]